VQRGTHLINVIFLFRSASTVPNLTLRVSAV